MPLLNEQIDGKYEILEKIREGGMGAIYKVRHRLLDEIRVVKVIRSHDPTGQAGDRFLSEARAAIKLRHPNVAMLHDFSVGEDGNAFIVMEFIDGWNLLEVLRGYGPPPIALTLEMARQSLKALGYLHRHKIVHRDVSPDNLMLTRDVDGHPLVKLIDLGIAKAMESSGGVTTTGVFLGKPRYGSPERFSGEGCDERSDLYSFGVVLYELLTGRAPITGGDPTALMAGHLFRPPIDFAETDPQGRVPPELRQIVLAALAKKPAERVASAEDFIWALTMLQDRYPLTREELVSVWSVLLPLETGTTAIDPPGSTQDRLDLEFALEATPPTGVLTAPQTRLTLVKDEKPLVAEQLPKPAAAPPQAVPHPEVTQRLEAAPATQAAGEMAMREARVDRPDLDATWATRDLRKQPAPAPEAPRREPAEPPPPVAVRGAAVARPSAVRILAAAGAALLFLGAAGGGWVWWSGREEPAPQAPLVEVTPGPTETVVDEPAGETQAEPSPSPAAPRTPQIAEALPQKPAEQRALPKPAPPAADEPEPEGLIRPGQLNVEAAEPKGQPRCVYPEPARGRGMTVLVKVRVLVGEDGRVIDARVQEGDSSGYGFNEATLDAARKVAFHPGTRAGVPGKMWSDLACYFEDPGPAAAPAPAPAAPPAPAALIPAVPPGR